MSTQIAQATEEIITPHNVVMTKGIQVRQTPNGDVAFINTEYVSQKLINLMVEMLSSEHYAHAGSGKSYGHGMFSVVFRIDGGPSYPNSKKELKPVPWLFNESGKTAICNLKECIILALEQGVTGKKGFENLYMMDVKTLVWHHILVGFAHECHHASKFMDEYFEIVTNPQRSAQEEVDADVYARLAIYDLAKSINVEMDMGPTLDSMFAEAWGLLWEELTTTPDSELSAHEKKFMEAQKEMMNSDIVWFGKAPDTEHEDHVLRTYKELLHHFSGDPADDPEWAIPVHEPHVEKVVFQNNTTDIGPEEECYDRCQVNQENLPQMPQAAAGFQGAVPQQQVNGQQQNWGYQPQTVQPTQQQAQPGMPVPPTGVLGQANPQATPYVPQNLPTGTNIGQNMNAVVGANAYPASTLTPQEFQTVINGLYNKLFAQVFSSCGFNPMNGPGNPFFMQTAKIVEPITLSVEEQKIVHSMECYGPDSKLQMDAKVTGWVSGRLMDKEMKLPGYALVLSNMAGQQIRRRLIPQNPWKTNKNGQYSQTALLAQQGTCLLWIIDPDAVDKQFATRINNGVFESNKNGSWQRVC